VPLIPSVRTSAYRLLKALVFRHFRNEFQKEIMVDLDNVFFMYDAFVSLNQLLAIVIIDDGNME
jgi:hypothetical protein